jgi:hypothetical protein
MYYFPYKSDKPDKKYYIITKDNKRVYFGVAGYYGINQALNKVIRILKKVSIKIMFFYNIHTIYYRMNKFIDSCRLLGNYNENDVYLYTSAKYDAPRLFY